MFRILIFYYNSPPSITVWAAENLCYIMAGLNCRKNFSVSNRNHDIQYLFFYHSLYIVFYFSKDFIVGNFSDIPSQSFVMLHSAVFAGIPPIHHTLRFFVITTGLLSICCLSANFDVRRKALRALLKIHPLLQPNVQMIPVFSPRWPRHRYPLLSGCPYAP